MKGAQGNRYFMWREEPETEGHLTERTATTNNCHQDATKIFF